MAKASATKQSAAAAKAAKKAAKAARKAAKASKAASSAKAAKAKTTRGSDSRRASESGRTRRRRRRADGETTRKRTISFDAEVLEAAEAAAANEAGGNLSALVNDALAHSLKVRAFGAFLRELDEEFGPVPASVRKEVEQAWED